jgi:glycosyltransferase involved in cell wall biosynthesis
VGDFSSELAKALADLGHSVHIITGVNTDMTNESLLAQSAPRKAIANRRASVKGPSLRSGHRRNQPAGRRSTVARASESTSSISTGGDVVVDRVIKSWGWGCWRRILDLARREGLEVLNVQYQTAAYGMHPAINFVPRTQGRPLIGVTFHDLRVPYLFPKAGPLRRWVVRTMARRAGASIATNREDYLDLQADVPADRLSLIPIGSNVAPLLPQGYDRSSERSRWGVGSDQILLGHFGFLNESKGGEELVRALAQLVEDGIDARLLMIGGRVGSSDPTNQAYAELIERLISDLGLEERVHRSGFVTPEEVSAALTATDVCLCPYRDGVSFRRGTLQAYLAHGCAIVTTHPQVELDEVRDGENMLLVAPRNPQQLAAAAMQVAGDPELRDRLSAGARSLASEFTWENIARLTVAFFGRLREQGT